MLFSKHTTSYLKVWLCKASCHSDHRGSEWTRDTDGGQELRNVRCQAERNRAIGIQIARGVVDVEAEVGDIQLPRVLKSIMVKIKAQVISLTRKSLFS